MSITKTLDYIKIENKRAKTGYSIATLSYNTLTNRYMFVYGRTYKHFNTLKEMNEYIQNNYKTVAN